MKHPAPKITAPAAHNTFGQTMLGFEHTLYANFHHLTYLPIFLFFVACGLFLSALFTRGSAAPARTAFYLVAILLVVAGVFII